MGMAWIVSKLNNELLNRKAQSIQSIICYLTYFKVREAYRFFAHLGYNEG